MSSTKITKYDLDDSVYDGLATTESSESFTKEYTEEYVQGYAQAQHTTCVVTLTVTDWTDNSQTVTANGVTSDNTVFISPSPSYYDAYAGAAIKCTVQDANSLTFACKEVPESDVQVNVAIWGVGV